MKSLIVKTGVNGLKTLYEHAKSIPSTRDVLMFEEDLNLCLEHRAPIVLWNRACSCAFAAQVAVSDGLKSFISELWRDHAAIGSHICARIVRHEQVVRVSKLLVNAGREVNRPGISQDVVGRHGCKVVQVFVGNDKTLMFIEIQYVEELVAAVVAACISFDCGI